MNILVTGGCGFIGSHIVEFYLSKGHQVHVIDDLSTGRLKNIESFQHLPNFKFDKADILKWRGLAHAVEKADVIYHMAAIIGMFKVISEPINVITSNIKGSERLLECIVSSHAKPRRVLIASSSSVYSKSKSKILRENDQLVYNSFQEMDILQNYAISKLVDEALGLAYFRALNIPVTIVRLFNTIGPRQRGRYGMVVPRFIKQACEGSPITVFGDGTQTRSFCDVRDVVQAFDQLVHQERAIGEIINVGFNREITINYLAKLIHKRAHSSSEIKHVPYENVYAQPLEPIKQRRPDLTKLFELTGFEHAWTLEKTIDDLILRFKQDKDNH